VSTNVHTIGSFKELAKKDEPFAGGKGRALARLYRAGYPVPDGFIMLPAAFSASRMPAAFAGDDLTTEARAQVQTHLARSTAETPGRRYVRPQPFGEAFQRMWTFRSFPFRLGRGCQKCFRA